MITLNTIISHEGVTLCTQLVEFISSPYSYLVCEIKHFHLFIFLLTEEIFIKLYFFKSDLPIDLLYQVQPASQVTGPITEIFKLIQI